MVMPAITSASYVPDRLHRIPLSDLQPDPETFRHRTSLHVLDESTVCGGSATIVRGAAMNCIFRAQGVPLISPC